MVSTSAAEKGAAGRGSAADCRCRSDPRQKRKHVLVAERLGEKVERPELDGLDSYGNAAVGRSS